MSTVPSVRDQKTALNALSDFKNMEASGRVVAKSAATPVPITGLINN
jgi:hypothetical protein